MLPIMSVVYYYSDGGIGLNVKDDEVGKNSLLIISVVNVTAVILLIINYIVAPTDGVAIGLL